MPPKSPFSFSFVTCWRLKFGCRERHAFGWAANAGLSPLNASGSQWKCDKFCHGFWYIVCFKTLGLEGTGEIQCHKYHLDDKHNQTWDFWCVLERTTWSWVLLQIYLFSIAKALVPDIWRRRTRAAQFDCKQSTIGTVWISIPKLSSVLNSICIGHIFRLLEFIPVVSFLLKFVRYP